MTSNRGERTFEGIMPAPQVLGAGLVTADIVQLCGPDWQPLANEPAAYYAGGTVGNVLCYLAAFGWKTRLLGASGDDLLGDVVRKDLGRFGVDVDSLLVRRRTYTRRIAHRIVADGARRGAHRFSTDCFACGRDFPMFPPPKYEEVKALTADAINESTVLLIDRANEFTSELASRVSQIGGLVVFEPGYLSRNKDVVADVLSKTDVLKYSNELEWNDRPFSQFLERKRYPRLKLVIETRSAKGVRARRGNKEITLSMTPIMQVHDTAGAGDAFMAGFLTGLGQQRVHEVATVTDRVLEESLQRGQALGALACLFVGSKGLLYGKPLAEIEDAIRTTWRQRRPPNEFESTQLARSDLVPTDISPGLCRVCLMPTSERR